MRDAFLASVAITMLFARCATGQTAAETDLSELRALIERQRAVLDEQARLLDEQDRDLRPHQRLRRSVLAAK
jgi:hypothetical protein